MPERPEVIAAKEKLATLLPGALEALEDLLDSPSQGARLGAARDILDRGGLPATQIVDQHVEVGLDDQISLLLGKLAKARQVAYEGAEALLSGPSEERTEQPSLFDSFSLQPAPELRYADDDVVADGEIVQEPIEAWWQASS